MATLFNASKFLSQIEKIRADTMTKINEEIQESLNLLSTEVKAEVRADNSFVSRTGKLKKSIITRQFKRGMQVRSNSRYARTIEYGSDPHTISARKKKWLRWPNRAGNGWIFKKSVKHPGTSARYFLSRAVDKAYNKMRKRFVSKFNQ